MSETARVLQAGAQAAEAGRAFVMITVIRTQGSTPRGPGAKMLYVEPGTALSTAAASVIPRDPAACFVGTVGGGQFEHLALEDARKHLRAGTSGVERYVLGADADQCCGGVMEVFFEFHGARTTAVIFGAGHVAFEIAKLLRGSAMRTVIVDDRADWNSEARFGGCERITDWDAGVQRACESSARSMAIVMTCSHDTDLQLLRRLLARGDARPAMVGLIGSRSKRACLFGRLVASGIDESLVMTVRCPIGVGDTGKEPAMVAISIAAELLIRAKRMDEAGSMKSTARRDDGPASVESAGAPSSASMDEHELTP